MLGTRVELDASIWQKKSTLEPEIVTNVAIPLQTVNPASTIGAQSTPILPVSSENWSKWSRTFKVLQRIESISPPSCSVPNYSTGVDLKTKTIEQWRCYGPSQLISSKKPARPWKHFVILWKVKGTREIKARGVVKASAMDITNDEDVQLGMKRSLQDQMSQILPHPLTQAAVKVPFILYFYLIIHVMDQHSVQ